MATAAASLLDSETFSASSQRDALGRVLKAISPDSSEVLYTYDEGGGLRKVELKHRGSLTAQTVVGDTTYNARGQRDEVVYGPTSSPTMTTSYGYDPLTYRLAHMSTIRESDDASLQGLHYHYDPVGNITDIRDTAQQTVYSKTAWSRRRTRTSTTRCTYSYDAHGSMSSMPHLSSMGSKVGCLNWRDNRMGVRWAVRRWDRRSCRGGLIGGTLGYMIGSAVGKGVAERIVE